MHADTSQAPAYIAGRKDKDARTRLDIDSTQILRP